MSTARVRTWRGPDPVGARVGAGFAVLLIVLAVTEPAGLGGLLERLLAAFGAAAIAALALRTPPADVH